MLKRNKSNKVFSYVINDIQNNYKNVEPNANNSAITINKNYYNKQKYNYSLPVSSKKISKLNEKKLYINILKNQIIKTTIKSQIKIK